MDAVAMGRTIFCIIIGAACLSAAFVILMAFLVIKIVRKIAGLDRERDPMLEPYGDAPHFPDLWPDRDESRDFDRQPVMFPPPQVIGEGGRG